MAFTCPVCTEEDTVDCPKLLFSFYAAKGRAKAETVLDAAVAVDATNSKSVRERMMHLTRTR